MLDYVNEVQVQYVKVPYARYWHGYLVILKPLLSFFSYADIRMMNMMCQMILICSFCALLVNLFGIKYTMPFFLTLSVLNPIVTGLNFQNSTSFYCSIIPAIVMLMYYNNSKKIEKMRFFFMIIGIVTVYFDFLTYPIVSLGIPLVLCLLMMSGDKNVWIIIRSELINSCYWAVGYCSMWAAKWIVASVILRQDVIGDALSQILFRTGIENRDIEKITIFQCWAHVMKVMIKPAYILLFIFSILIAVLFIFLQIRKSKNKLRKVFLYILPYLIVASYPFIWWAGTKNHCIQNSKFVYRDFCIFIFSIGCGIIRAFESGYGTLDEKDK